MLNKFFNRKYYKAMEELDFEISCMSKAKRKYDGLVTVYLGDKNDDRYKELVFWQTAYGNRLLALEALRRNIISINA